MPRDWNRFVKSHLRDLGLTPEREADVVAELALEFEQAYQDAVAAGYSEVEASHQAEAHVKDWQALAAELRAANEPALPPIEPPNPSSPFSGLAHDFRFALRTLRLNPGFAAIAALTLAFGIGGNTAIFTVADHLALKGLPYQDAPRLVVIEHTRADQPETDTWTAIDNLLDFRRRSKTLASIAGISPVWNLVLTGEGATERLEALYVSAEFLPMLGVQPVLGRLFTADEDNRTQPSARVILSHGFWQRRFGGARDIVGRPLRLDGQQMTVIGVLPAEFRWRGEPLSGTSIQPDIWLPLGSNQLAQSARTLRFLKVIGKVRRDSSVQAAIGEVSRIGAELTTEFPAANRNLTFSAMPLETRINGRAKPAIYLLVGTVGFVLLMASANVANLLLARTAARQRELTVRVALGASGQRLMRQLMVESLVLAAMGGIPGLLLAQALIRLITAYGPPSMFEASGISLDGRALLFTSMIVLITALLAGMIPAWRALLGCVSREAMRQGRGVTGGSHRVRAALMMTQISIALALLIGSGLLVRSFLRVLAIPPGFNAHNILSISTQVPTGLTAEKRTQTYNEIRKRLLATPGVVNVAAVSRLPMLGQTLTSLLEVEGRNDAGHPPEVEFRAATPDYFPVMGIPLLAGRLFEERDPANLQILLIDELTAKRSFPGVDPVGKRIRFLADRKAPWFTIVGVVGSIRHFGLEAEARPTIYRPAAINPLNSPVLVIRTATVPGAIAEKLARVVRGVHPTMPAYNIFVMDDLILKSTAERRFLMWLVTAFAIAALILAGVGVYGSISQSVAQRTQEIGVRMALGAPASRVMRMVFFECFQTGAPGIVAGSVLGWLVGHVGRKLLYEVQPHDVRVFAVAILAIVLFAALACYSPVRRAVRVDPLTALRIE